jgi:hypothetical protein
MEHSRKDGFNMYTKILRKMVAFSKTLDGHCDGNSGNGHCS